MASALVACARLGLRTKYIGAVGDDFRGQIQMESYRYRHQPRSSCSSAALAPINPPTSSSTHHASAPCCGAATNLSTCNRGNPRRDDSGARLLHIDGHDTRPSPMPRKSPAATAFPSPSTSIPIYRFDASSPTSITSSHPANSPSAWTGQADPFLALETIQRQYRMRVAAMTLGGYGSLAREDGCFHYAPASW